MGLVQVPPQVVVEVTGVVNRTDPQGWAGGEEGGETSEGTETRGTRGARHPDVLENLLPVVAGMIGIVLLGGALCLAHALRPDDGDKIALFDDIKKSHIPCSCPMEPPCPLGVVSMMSKMQ